MQDKWSEEHHAKCVTECGHIKNQDKSEIIFSKDLWHVIQAMLRKHPQDEWQMLLSGAVEKDVCYCTGYYITKQEVSGGTVENKDVITKEVIDQNKFVCTIHSHVNMGVTPSSTDIEDSVLGSLIEYHTIVNNRHDLKGMKRQLLPCGSVCVRDCDVLIENDVDINKIEIVGLENISKKSYVTEYYGGHTTYGKPGWKDTPGAPTYRDYEDYDAEVYRHLQEMNTHYGY